MLELTTWRVVVYVLPWQSSAKRAARKGTAESSPRSTPLYLTNMGPVLWPTGRNKSESTRGGCDRGAVGPDGTQQEREHTRGGGGGLAIAARLAQRPPPARPLGQSHALETRCDALLLEHRWLACAGELHIPRREPLSQLGERQSCAHET